MLETVLSLALFALVATVTPGGATTLATASGVRFGFRRSVPLLVGIAVGLAALSGLAAVGLAAALQAAPALQSIMKVIGTAYLLWLAWKIASSGPPPAGSHDGAAPTSFWGGLLLLWLNPKAWAMALAAVTSFAAVASDPLQRAIILALTFGLAASLSLTAWCLGGSLLARVLRSAGQWRAVNVTLGLLLVASIIPMWVA